MKIFLSITGWLALAVFVLWYQECAPKCNTASIRVDTVIDRQYIHDAPKPSRIVYKDAKERTIIQRLVMPGVHDTVFRSIDTLQLIRDYFAHLYYSDTVHSKFGYIIIVDTVFQNRIQGRAVTFDIGIPEKTITQIPKPKTQFFAGFDVGFGVGVGAALKTKRDRIFSLDYIITQHGGIAVLGYKVPIKVGL